MSTPTDDRMSKLYYTTFEELESETGPEVQIEEYTDSEGSIHISRYVRIDGIRYFEPEEE